MLKAHSKVAVSTLESLSKKQAKQVAKARQKLQELPWDIAIIVDSTLQHRASLHPENAKTFNHGQGFVVGHQWTNIVLLLNDLLIPLRPIPFYSQRYCRDRKLAYRTEHDLVVEYIQQLQLEEYIGSYDPREVVVLTDSGYDNKKIQNAIAAKQWHFLIALGKTRSVKSAMLSLHHTQVEAVVSLLPRSFAITAGSSGKPFVSRRMGQSGSEWSFAPETRLDICATWGKSNWCAQSLENDRRVAASI